MRAAQEVGVAQRMGLTSEQTDAAAWTITPGGASVVGGPRAVALVLSVARNSKLPLLPFKVPGIPWLLDRVYEVIARNRHRLPGDTPWCVANAGCHPKR